MFYSKLLQVQKYNQAVSLFALLGSSRLTALHIMMMKLNQGFNFTKIAIYASRFMLLGIFLSLQFGFVLFWQKEINAKATHKMLVKLAEGLE